MEQRLYSSRCVPSNQKVAHGEYSLLCEYHMFDVRQNMSYRLEDGTYSKYPCFMHSILSLWNERESYFTARQEGKRKSIERGFGVLKAKFYISALPSKLWKKSTVKTIIYWCVILNNMIINDLQTVLPVRERQSRSITIGDEVKHCFAFEDCRPLIGTISAVCVTNAYLNWTFEYMTSRRLLFELTCSERERNNK